MNIDIIETVCDYLDMRDIIRCSILSKSINTSLHFVLNNRQLDKQLEMNKHSWCRTCNSRVNGKLQHKIFVCNCNSFSFFHKQCDTFNCCPVCNDKPILLCIHNKLENKYMKCSKY